MFYLSKTRLAPIFPLLGMVITACATSGGEPPNLRRCHEPRPQVCTREYLPVCGERKNGGWKTYGNDCDACADPEVVRHRPAACQP